MALRFEDATVDREGLLSLGRDRQGGQYYLSIPVANQMVDYEEHFRLDAAEYARFLADRQSARIFADECRARLHDDRLILPPGSDRGIGV